jgi:glycosyltransferase involved in cell wall biosynthesis
MVVVQVVDGGPGGAGKVARAIATVQPFTQRLVLTGGHPGNGAQRPDELVIPTSGSLGSKLKLVARLCRVLWSHSRPRVLVAHRDWLACRVAGIATRTRVIFVSHGSGLAHGSRKDRAHMLAYRGQRFVSVGAGAQAGLARRFGRASVVIENGVPIPEFVPPTPPPPFTLVYLGRFESGQKRPHIPVLLTARLAGAGIDVQTVMLGDGPLRTDLERLASSQGVEDRVTFPGWVADTARYLEAAHVLVHSTWWEGNPLSVLEALAAGRPAVVSRVPGTESVADCPGVTLVPSADSVDEVVEDFADAVTRVHRLLQDDGADRHYRAIHEHARQRFSTERMAEEWRGLLERVARGQ